MQMSVRKLIGIFMMLSIGMCLPQVVNAHCDTLDGPVVTDARIALAKGDVTPALKWVTPEKEEDLRAAFANTLKVRGLSPDAQKLADTYFFETLVRVHRAGEGAPYTGLKAAGTAPEPGIKEADTAIETGNADPLIKHLIDELTAGIRLRFTEVMEKKQHANDSVQAGREFVEAYVIFIHYIERLQTDITAQAAHGEADHHAESAETYHTEEAH